MWIIIAIVNGFNTQPHEGGCRTTYSPSDKRAGFNTQPHEGGCCHYKCHVTQPVQFQHTAARRRLLIHSVVRCVLSSPVSTHSRTKAAALSLCTLQHTICGFNTQPHEGGCRSKSAAQHPPLGFNTQPHEGGCLFKIFI